MIPIAGPQPTGLFTGLPAGTYYIQVTSEDCAEVSSPVVITDPDHWKLLPIHSQM